MAPSLVCYVPCVWLSRQFGSNYYVIVQFVSGLISPSYHFLCWAQSWTSQNTVSRCPMKVNGRPHRSFWSQPGIYRGIYQSLQAALQRHLMILSRGSWGHLISRVLLGHGPLARYVKLRVAHAPGMPGTFSPPLPVSDPDMHHGTCITHMPRCMPGSLNVVFFKVGGEENVPAFPAHVQPAILRIWQEAHWWCARVPLCFVETKR